MLISGGFVSVFDSFCYQCMCQIGVLLKFGISYRINIVYVTNYFESVLCSLKSNFCYHFVFTFIPQLGGLIFLVFWGKCLPWC